MSTFRDVRSELLNALETARTQGSFIRLVLGKPGVQAGLFQRVTFRPVLLKAGLRWQVARRTKTQETVENLPPEQAFETASSLLGVEFLSALLETDAAVWQLELWPERPGKLSRKARSAIQSASPEHNRPKTSSVDFSAPWWRELGVTDQRGQVRPGMAAKQGQIQKFAELLRHDLSLATLAPDGPLRLADLGSGKGYLTFAAWEVLSSLGRPVEVIGVERRPDLVASCSAAAVSGHCSGLRFVQGDIGTEPLVEGTLVTALHACDTATDDALRAAIEARSPLILAAPCCHREVRGQLVTPSVLSGLLEHGIQQERMAESLTDALRALALTSAGYRTRVFEFISTEHTHKNVMISAVLMPPSGQDLRPKAWAEAKALRSLFGIRHQKLLESLSAPL